MQNIREIHKLVKNSFEGMIFDKIELFSSKITSLDYYLKFLTFYLEKNI